MLLDIQPKPHRVDVCHTTLLQGEDTSGFMQLQPPDNGALRGDFFFFLSPWGESERWREGGKELTACFFLPFMVTTMGGGGATVHPGQWGGEDEREGGEADN